MGSALGVLWAVLQPLSLVAVYWFVFTYMFTPRGVVPNRSYVDFLIAGLLPWIGFNEGVSRSITTIVDNSATVRRLAVRSEILVLVPNASAILFQLVAIALYALILLARGGSLAGVWILPFAVAIQFAMQVGIGWILAPAYVVFRDVAPFVTFAMSILFYLSPILYPVGGRFAVIFGWNPLTPLLGLFRSALLAAPLPPLSSIVFLLVFATGIAAAGLALFRRARGTLADLL